MAERYEGRVEFLLVYIREAHPVDGRQVARNVREGVLLPTATTEEEKDQHAGLCALKLDIGFTTVVDGLDNAAELAYTAWPDRLYLVGRDGRIAWKSRPGPAGFRPDQLQVEIERMLNPAP
jgi:type I thyroxine 5'-deiodinase